MENIFKEHHARLCHFAWQIIRDREATKDIVQDAFLVYWNNKASVPNDPIAIKNFLYKLVKNACLNKIRHDKVVNQYAKLTGNSEREESQIVAKIIRAEVVSEIHKILKTMPDGCQTVFRMGYIEGLTNVEIADKLQISVNTVKTQKQRGLKIIKKNLGSEFFALISGTLFNNFGDYIPL